MCWRRKKIYEDTIMGHRSELLSASLQQHLHCAAPQCCPSQFAFILTWRKPGGVKRNYTFLTISMLFFFSFLSSYSSLAVQQPHFFSTKYLWLKACSATMGRQSRARCTRYHKVEPQQPSSFWVSPWKALRIKHIFSLTFTCCWALIHKIVFSLVVNMG